MADQLSEDELRELLSATRPRAKSSSPEGFTRTPMSYDFKRPQRVNKDQTRTLESIHEHFARLFSTTLATSMRMVVDVELAFTDQALYNEFILSLPNPCSAYSFTVHPPDGRAVLNFAPELLMAVIDRAFGGKGRAYTGDPRPLTPLEMNVVNKLVSRLLKDLEVSWEPLTPIEIREAVLETNPEFIQLATPGENVVVVALEANSSNASGLIHLCYPLLTLESLLPKLIPQQRATRRREQTAPQPPTAPPATLRKMKVPVLIQLARGTLPLGEVAELKVGDVIKLDTQKQEPAVVFLSDRPKFLGRPGLKGRKRAVEILKSLEPEEEDLYS